MKIKEFVKKNRRAMKIAGIITAAAITDYVAYNIGRYNGVVYGTRTIASVLSMDERNDISDRLDNTSDI